MRMNKCPESGTMGQLLGKGAKFIPSALTESSHLICQAADEISCRDGRPVLPVLPGGLRKYTT